MPTFYRSSEFDKWLKSLKDNIAKARIIQRVRSAELGNFGDATPVGEGVSELRIHVGPGYRVYFARRGEFVYLLLVGGDKSTQAKDIARAKQFLRDLPEGEP